MKTIILLALALMASGCSHFRNAVAERDVRDVSYSDYLGWKSQGEVVHEREVDGYVFFTYRFNVCTEGGDGILLNQDMEEACRAKIETTPNKEIEVIWH